VSSDKSLFSKNRNVYVVLGHSELFLRATNSFVELEQTRPTYLCWNLFGDIRSAIVLFEDKTDCLSSLS
jgi:hypothetical protein